MRSTTPKVLHEIAGRSLLGHALAAGRALDPARLAVVVRHGRDVVVAHLREVAPDALVADQDEVPGTGRAVTAGLAALDGAADAAAVVAGGTPGEGIAGPVVVLAGDIPLLDGPTLAELLARHREQGNAVTVLTAVVADPTGYGRIVREPGSDQVARIVEHRDADEAERAITEINSSVYVFDAAVLRGALGRLGRDNAQGEVYLTDVLALARKDGGAVRAVVVADPVTVEGVNDRVQLATLRAELNRRILERWMVAGVTVVDPATTWVDVEVELAPDVTLLPGTQLHGRTRVAGGATVGPDTTLTDVEIAEGATVVRSHGSGARIGPGATVGPFSYLRPGTDLGEAGKIGAYVETKNAVIGAHSKVPHLTYVGDAEIGEHSNLGAATIIANYDGVAKHRTTIGSHVRIGSDSVLVAPVTIGDGAYTGAGSVIRDDVPPGALALSTPARRTIDGWVLRRRAGTGPAEAAAAALAAAGEGLTDQARAERDRAETGGLAAGERSTSEGHAPR